MRLTRIRHESLPAGAHTGICPGAPLRGLSSHDPTYILLDGRSPGTALLAGRAGLTRDVA